MSYDRTLLGLVASLAVGLAMGTAAGAWGVFWPLALALALTTAVFGYAFAWRFWGFAALVLLGLALALSGEARRRGTLEAAAIRGGPFAAEVTVERSLGATAFQTEFGGLPLTVVLGREAGTIAPREGERWRIAGWLAQVPVADHRRRKVWVSGRGTSAERLAPASGWRRALARARASLSRRLGWGLERQPRTAALLRAMVLGERSAMSGAERDVFVRSGAVHLFAISGLHVGVVAMLFYLVARALFWVPHRWAGTVAVLPLWAYVLLIGSPPSALRAGAMMTMGLLAPACWRRVEPLTAWCLVFLLVHAAHPEYIASVGSLLSFAVMFALVAWARSFRRGFTLAAWAAGVPIAAHCFGTFTPAGLLANLVLIPAAVVAVTAGVTGLAVGFLSHTLAAHVNNLAALFVRAMTGVAEAISALPGASFAVQPWPYWVCALWYVALALGFWELQTWRARRPLAYLG